MDELGREATQLESIRTFFQGGDSRFFLLINMIAESI